MLTTRWQPFAAFSDLNRLHDEMGRLFQEGDVARRSFSRSAYPPINVWEDEERMFVEMELPGLELEDLEILIVGNKLTVKGERKRPSLDGMRWLHQERGFGSFQREFLLPERVEGDKVDAKLNCGVLTITLPKRAEDKPRRIEVRST